MNTIEQIEYLDHPRSIYGLSQTKSCQKWPDLYLRRSQTLTHFASSSATRSGVKSCSSLKTFSWTSAASGDGEETRHKTQWVSPWNWRKSFFGAVKGEYKPKRSLWKNITDSDLKILIGEWATCFLLCYTPCHKMVPRCHGKCPTWISRSDFRPLPQWPLWHPLFFLESGHFWSDFFHSTQVTQVPETLVFAMFCDHLEWKNPTTFPSQFPLSSKRPLKRIRKRTSQCEKRPRFSLVLILRLYSRVSSLGRLKHQIA